MPQLIVTDTDDDPEPDGVFEILRYGDEITIAAYDVDDDEIASAVTRWLARGAHGPMQ